MSSQHKRIPIILSIISDIALGYLTINLVFSRELIKAIDLGLSQYSLTMETTQIEGISRFNLGTLYSRLGTTALIISNLMIFSASLIIALAAIVHMNTSESIYRSSFHKIITSKNIHRIVRMCRPVLFQLSLFLLLNSFDCEEIELIISETDSYISQTSFTSSTTTTKNSAQRVKVLHLNNNIACTTLSQSLVLMIFSASMMLLITSEIMGRTIEEITLNKEWLSVINYSSYYTAYTLLAFIILLNQLILTDFSSLSIRLELILLLETSVLLISATVAYLVRPNYNKEISRAIQIRLALICSTMIFVTAIVYAAKNEINVSKSSIRWIGGLLITTVLIRIHKNLSDKSTSGQLVIEQLNRGKINRPNILLLYFEIIDYFQDFKKFTRYNNQQRLKTQALYWIQVLKTISPVISNLIAKQYEIQIKKNCNIEMNFFEALLRIVKDEFDNILCTYVQKHTYDKTIIIIYLNFLIDAQGGFTKMLWFISSKESRGYSPHLSNFENLLMKMKLQSKISKCIFNGRFNRLYEKRPVLSNTHKGILDYASLIGFVDLFEKSKRDIKSSINYRKETLCELNEIGVIGRIHQKIRKSYEKIIYTETELNTLYKLAGDRYSPLSMLLLFYYRDIERNQQECRRYFRDLENSRTLININLFSEVDNASDLIIIIVGGEYNDLHKIQAVYGDLSIIKQHKEELVNSDLSRLLPNAFKESHAMIIKNSNAYDSLLESKEKLYLFAYGVDGCITRVSIKIRLSYTYDNGIRYIGYLEMSEKTVPNEMVALVTPQGIISDITCGLTTLVKQGDDIRDLSPSLSEELQKMAKVITSFWIIDKKDVFKDPQLREVWEIYIRLLNGKKINLHKSVLDKKITIRVKVSIEELVFRQLNFLWVFKFTFGSSDEEMIQINTPFIKGTKADELKLYLQKSTEDSKPSLNGLKHDSKISTANELSYRVDLEIKQKEASENRLKFTIAPNPSEIDERSQSLSELRDNGRRECVFRCLSGSNNHLRQLESDAKNIIDPILSNNNWGSSSNPGIIDDELNILNNSAIKYLTNEAYVDDSNKRSGYLRDLDKKIIANQIRDSIKSKAFIIERCLQLGLTILVFFILLYFQNQRLIVFRLTNEEILDKAYTIDHLAWQTVGTVYCVFYLEMCRVVRSELTSNSLEIFGNSNTMYDGCNEQLHLYGAMQLSVDLYIEDSLNRLLFSNLFDLSSFRRLNISVERYESEPNGKITWRNVSLERQSAVIAISGLANRFIQRDYEADRNIPFYNIGENDRDFDPQEEEYRRNLLGPIDKHFTLRMRAFTNYIIAVNDKNINNLEIELISSFIITVLFMGTFNLIILYKIRRIRFFYETLFQIKVDFE